MHRIFLPKENIPIISGSDAHYVKNVLRMKVADSLKLLDGNGTIYIAKIAEIKKDEVVCKIVSSCQDQSEPKIKVTIAQGLPKAKKMDLIIQKCTELGVCEIIPMLTERAIGKSAKSERWQKIAKEAAEQSGRAIIPKITQLTKFPEVTKLAQDYDLALIPWELETSRSLKSALSSLSISPSHHLSILILIGPEGGFSQKEAEAAKQAGCLSVSLGSRILRTETASLAILSMINYEYGQ